MARLQPGQQAGIRSRQQPNHGVSSGGEALHHANAKRLCKTAVRAVTIVIQFALNCAPSFIADWDRIRASIGQFRMIVQIVADAHDVTNFKIGVNKSVGFRCGLLFYK